ncbi:hypothetical protein BCR36DRAFT_579577 [Piromyces finnis]|uniref:Uncharacterized protein n=1 Tax=Piromyces finnis TaxID=1754191 RepID=A0A1Y1VMJ0_9FUNG|nr:hypothetical protein BCR36DRAFT_579577 [Piromyces finnis]|eukprot:ORX60133.1 hypothetical protein BCR36DRAFT_579577 [Piromyces finnis]
MAFEDDYNYRCDTFIKDCVSYYEEKLDCPLILMEDKMENIIINRKMFLYQVIMILALIVIYHIKITNFLKYSCTMPLFKKLRNQNSMKWYHDVLLSKDKEINLMKRDINISLNQINNYIEYDINEDKLIKGNNEEEEISIDNTKENSTNFHSQQFIDQPSLTEIVDNYNKAIQSKSRSANNINIKTNTNKKY